MRQVHTGWQPATLLLDYAKSFYVLIGLSLIGLAVKWLVELPSVELLAWLSFYGQTKCFGPNTNHESTSKNISRKDNQKLKLSLPVGSTVTELTEWNNHPTKQQLSGSTQRYASRHTTYSVEQLTVTPLPITPPLEPPDVVSTFPWLLLLNLPPSLKIS